MLLGKDSLVTKLLVVGDLICVKITDYASTNKYLGNRSLIGMILLREYLKAYKVKYTSVTGAYNRPADE